MAVAERAVEAERRLQGVRVEVGRWGKGRHVMERRPVAVADIAGEGVGQSAIEHERVGRAAIAVIAIKRGEELSDKAGRSRRRVQAGRRAAGC